MNADEEQQSVAFVRAKGAQLLLFARLMIPDREDPPFLATKVPAGTLFVLDDNRSAANDSWCLGPVPTDAVEGVGVAIGDQHVIPGAPHHNAPGGQDIIDPPSPRPPASTTNR